MSRSGQTSKPKPEEMNASITASFAMACSLCFHFFGYEMARAASISLLAAKVSIVSFQFIEIGCCFVIMYCYFGIYRILD